MKKYLFFYLLLTGSMNLFGQFVKKDSLKLAGDEITFLTIVNLDTDTLPETVSAVRKGSFWFLYATKFSAGTATTTLLADSISTTTAPTLLEWNGDNLIDFVFLTPGAQNILVLQNQRNLKFTKIKTSIGSQSISKIRFTQLKNDGHRQAVLIKSGGGWSVYQQEGNTFTLTADSSNQVTDFYTFDFDGNGYQDIALSGADALGKPYLKVLHLEDSFRVKRMVQISPAINGKMEAADLNYDGQFDLVVAGKNNLGQTAIQSFLNNNSTFVGGSAFRTLSSPSLTLADFDSDGKVDLAAMGKDSGGSLLHWLKTDAGDSVSFPTANVTLRAFSDYDRDGDLDLAIATDTLGVVLFENPALKNQSPSATTKYASAFLFNRMFIYWDPSTDDHTNPVSLTYDLILRQSGSEIVNGEFDASGGLRLTTTNGNRSTRNFFLTKVEPGTYDYRVEGIDNSFFAKKIIGGASGSCTLAEPKTITFCDHKPATITAPQPVLWFSFAHGYLGTSGSLKVPAKTDTIFSFFPQAISNCNSITIYLLKALKADTLKVTQHFIGCEGTLLSFHVTDEWKNVTWKDAHGSAKGTGNSLNYPLTKDETIIGIGSNSHGCFIKQTENIQLSKPALSLEGTDYRILRGNSVQLGVLGAQEYSWQPPTGLDDTTSPHPLASPATTTLYTVTGIDSLGCSSQAQVLVEVHSVGFVPNLFTPNGDGKNDELKVYGLTNARDFHFAVYNREGNLVYESTDWENVNWDGMKNGTQQPAGLYYWKVEGSFVNGEPLRLNEKSKGSILLVR